MGLPGKLCYNRKTKVELKFARYAMHMFKYFVILVRQLRNLKSSVTQTDRYCISLQAYKEIWGLIIYLLVFPYIQGWY